MKFLFSHGRHHTRALLTILSVILIQTLVFAQVSINTDGADPHPSSGLDVNFSDRGFLPPRLTTAQRDAIVNPAEGLTIYNITTLCIETFISSIWQAIGCGCSSAPSAPLPGLSYASSSEINWVWNPSNSASGYRYGLTNSYESSVDLGNATNHIQPGSFCGASQQTLYVWAYNACGHSGSSQLTVNPPPYPSVSAITGTTTLNAGATTQLNNGTPGGVWSSLDVSRATVNQSGLVSALMQGSPVIEYSITQNGCTSTASTALTVNWVCGTPLPKNHVQGTVAPINKTVNYATVTTSLSGSSKCWITQNLGSGQQASSATDATFESAGWYWKFNRKQGYAYDGSLTPTWPTSAISEGANWGAGEDPCLIELGTGWRLPTNTEYVNVDANGSWNTYTDSYNSVLKIHAAGTVTGNSGAMENLGNAGTYWASNSANNTEGKFLWVRSNGSSANHDGGKSFGFTIRCIKD